VICVYALVSRAPSRISIRGVAGERLHALRGGGITAIVGEVARMPSPSIPHLKRYAAIIDALAAQVPAILPARYATTVGAQDELAFILGARNAALRGRLRAVSGRVQMTIRIVAPPQPPARRPQSGTEYLRQRLVTAPALAPIQAAVRADVSESHVERKHDIVTVNHLVRRTAVPRYCRSVERAAAQHHVRLVVTGPRPPYAFADTW